MKQGPLFRRRFFAQKPLSAVPSPQQSTAVEYLRLQGHAANPGALLQGQRVFLAPGGVLDLVAESRGGSGVGRVGYPPALHASVKRGEEFLTYRFQVPPTSAIGERFPVSCQGTDNVPAFHFTVEVGSR